VTVLYTMVKTLWPLLLKSLLHHCCMYLHVSTVIGHLTDETAVSVSKFNFWGHAPVYASIRPMAMGISPYFVVCSCCNCWPFITATHDKIRENAHHDRMHGHTDKGTPKN
jgi:hypothetical protein